ncbi:ADP-ribose pyrophosphatase [Idiomarina fontislapidosi]|uniref:ADP-ribose pyrophosphatase n=1 Tax=Idiomarina fontislapidosi TaxID=263723 RepID=A0A432XV22_9GAMM|nr:NUDIX domain-containing protein [Idiomarina fontislapidosi]PYE31822.1 ADP-ribose pyrophosphatase [Idiomarina fontislapidosi]RUO52503.1 ADP-ribose diphosphatase [Idiomarina fontislapidosi]
MKQFSKNDVQIESKDSLYKGFLSVNQYQLKHKLFAGGWGPTITRELMERGDAVVVIPYDPVTHELVVLEQFRMGAMANEHGPWLLEFVAGMFDGDETAEQVAHRELYEEAGLRAKQLVKALSYYSSPGGTDERLTIYIAEVDASQAAEFAGVESEHEDIRVHVKSFESVIEWLNQGRINNAASVIGLQWLQLHINTLPFAK